MLRLKQPRNFQNPKKITNALENKDKADDNNDDNDCDKGECQSHSETGMRKTSGFLMVIWSILIIV